MSRISESSKFIFYVAASVICLQSFSQSLFPDTALIRSFGGPAMDVGRDIQCTSEGGFIIAGTTSSCGSGNTAVYLIKTDSAGKHQWSKAIGGIGIEWGYSVKQTFDGGYVTAGYTNSFGNGGYDMYLVKTDSAGNILWEKSYGGSDWDFGYCVQQTPDSGFVLCGETYSYGSGNTDAFFVRTDKNGDTLWTRTAGGDSVDVANSIIVYNDSTYFYTGETNSTGYGGSDMFFGKIDKSGNVYPTKTIGTTKNDIGHCIEKTMDGNILIFGETDSVPGTNTGPNEILTKINPNGDFLWLPDKFQVYGSSGIDIGQSVKEKTNGELLTCGINPLGLGGLSLHMMMLNSGGWWLSGPGFGDTGDEEGYSLVITPAKKVAYVGSTTSYGQGLEDVYLIILKKDSIVMNYTLSKTEFADTCSGLSIAENEIASNVQIYPNPFSESAVLEIKNAGFAKMNLAFTLYDVFGRELRKYQVRNEKIEIKKENLKEAVYFYSVSSEKEIISQGKLVIQ